MAHEEQPAGGVSRRRVILNGAGLAAAGLVVGAAVPLAASGISGGSAEPAATGTGPAAAPSDPVMVHLRDAGSGQFDVFVGTRHVQFTDRAFAARLTEVATAD